MLYACALMASVPHNAIRRPKINGLGEATPECLFSSVLRQVITWCCYDTQTNGPRKATAKRIRFYSWATPEASPLIRLLI